MKLLVVLLFLFLIPLILGFNHVFADSSTVTIVNGAGSSANADCVNSGNCFSPQVLSTNVGNSVIWNNADSISHTVTSGQVSDANTGSQYNSGLIKPGSTYQVTFSVPGTYDYFCSIHPWMTGQVIVSENAQNQTPTPSPYKSPSTNNLQNTIHYKMIFVYSLGQCSALQTQALEFYQSITDQFLAKYGYVTQPDTWCVSKDDLTTAIVYGGSYDLTIIIPDILTSLPYSYNTNALGHYALAGNTRSIISTAYSLTPESAFSAWTLSHELSHFALNYKGYPSNISVDWVHQIQALKNTCEAKDFSLQICPNLWTTIQAPSGRAIPVMKIYDGPAPSATNNNPTPTTTPPPSPICPSGYYYHASNNLCYQIVPPSLTLGTPNVNGLGVTISGQSQAITFDSSINKISWDWGDGHTEIGWFPKSHIYSQAGSYNVKITAYDNMGSWKSVSETITVKQPPPTCPSGYYYQSSDNLCHPLVQPSLNQQTSSNVVNTNPFTSLTATMSTTTGILDVTGYISPQFYNRGNQIEIIIDDQNGNQRLDQTFLTTQQVSQNIDITSWTDGTYDMKVKYGAYESPDVFFIKSEHVNQNKSVPDNVKSSGPPSNPMKVDGTDLSVKYSITNGKVLGIKADTQSKSLIVSIQTTGDGVLTIILPRALINATLPTGQDDKYYVLVDGQGADFQETSTTTTDRTLSIPFKDGTQEIEIIGSSNLGAPSGMPSSNQPTPQSSTTTQQSTTNPTQVTQQIPVPQDDSVDAISSDGSLNVEINYQFNQDENDKKSVHWYIFFKDFNGQQIPHSNYAMSIMQDGHKLLDQTADYAITGAAGGQISDLNSFDPIGFKITYLGVGLQYADPSSWTGSKGASVILEIPKVVSTPSQSTSTTFTISTDKTTYKMGDVIMVSGTTTNWSGNSISVNLIDPDGNTIGLQPWKISSDGTFSEKIDTSNGNWKSGTYSFQGSNTTFQFDDKPKSCFLFWCW